MRTQPFEDDTLFQVGFTVVEPVDNHPVGPRHAATFAHNWLEACDMVRKKYGEENAPHVIVDTVTTIDRSSGERVETSFYERLPDIAVPVSAYA